MTWIVSTTKPKAEFIAKMKLERLGYDVYLPLITTPDKPEASPMFPRYLFVDLEPLDGLWRPILSQSGICAPGVLKTGDEPSKIPAKHINLMREREEAGVIRLKRRKAVADLKPGQAVRIHEGCFTGFEAVFERTSARECVAVLLTFLGQATSVELPAEAVAPIVAPQPLAS